MKCIVKKFISALMGLAVLSSCMALPAFADSLQNAEDELTDGTFTFEKAGGSYKITKCEPTAIIESIPEFRNGYAVTAIGDNAFANCTAISKLDIPDTIKSIGDNAFAGCTSLKEVNLPEKIDSVSSGLFMGCTRLESIDIPDSVKNIGSYAFYNCSMLADVELPASLMMIQPMAFAECSSIENINADNTPEFVFEGGMLYNANKTAIYRASTKLSGDLYIENSVATIEPGAFSVCIGIENLFLSSGLQTIGEDSFGYCINLKKIDFAEGLTKISDIAFKHCTSLQTADFPTTLLSIGEGAFFNCTELNRVTIPDGVETIGTGAFVNCKNLERVSVPKSIKEIGENAFAYNIDENGNYLFLKGFEMSVYSDSEGMKYAKNNGINYSSIDKNIAGIAFIVIGAGAFIIVVFFAFNLMRRGKKGAPLSAKKAKKQKEEEENYKNIIE